MNYSLIANRLRTKIGQFSGYVSDGLDKTASRFVSEAVYGLMSSRSVMLTEIGRSLQSEVKLKKIEERFCRQLAKPDLWKNIHDRVLSHAKDKITEKTLLILDPSDIHKPYAKKMEHLAYVRDGSTGNNYSKGYNTNQIIACNLGSKEVIPLYQELYSKKEEGFKSENKKIMQSIEMVSKYTGNKGVWVIDRGADRRRLYEELIHYRDPTKTKNFIIRMIGNRHLIYNGKSIKTLTLAHKCKTYYTRVITKQTSHGPLTFHVSCGFKKVKLPGFNQQLYMMVAKGFGKKPMMLLTTLPLRKNRKVLQDMLASYLQRWSIEETIRFVKQSYDLENIRVLSYTRLQNMMALLLAAFYFQAVILSGAQKLVIMTGHVLKEAKRVFGIPLFQYYAIGDGLSAIFKRAPGIITAKKNKNLNPNQLNFGFT